MSVELTNLQHSILTYIQENNDAHTWVPIEPDAFEGRSIGDLERDCRELERKALLEVDYPTTSLYAIKPSGERAAITNPNDWMLCAITVDGIKAIEAS